MALSQPAPRHVTLQAFVSSSPVLLHRTATLLDSHLRCRSVTFLLSEALFLNFFVQRRIVQLDLISCVRQPNHRSK